MAKKIVQKKKPSVVRLTSTAKGKLEVIAARKDTTLGNAVSSIILHYAANNLDYEVSTEDAYKAILSKFSGVVVTLSKIAGSSERTEDFIKTLVRTERHGSPDFPEPRHTDIDDPQTEHADDDRLSQALSMLENFFSAAESAFDFEGKRVMQIRMSNEKFLQVKTIYDELCTSRPM